MVSRLVSILSLILWINFYLFKIKANNNESSFISQGFQIRAKLAPQKSIENHVETNSIDNDDQDENYPLYQYDYNEASEIRDKDAGLLGAKEEVNTNSEDEELAPAFAAAPYPLVVYYRVTVYIANVRFVDDLRNADSELFQTTSNDLAQSLEDLYSNVPGEHYVTVLKFEPVGGTFEGSVASMDIGTLDNGVPSGVEGVLLNAVESGRIGRFDVTKDKYTFRQVSVDTPRPTTQQPPRGSGHHGSAPQANQGCANYEFRCRDNSCIDARRRCDGKPHCPDHSDESREWGRCNLEPILQLNVTELTLNYGETMHLFGRIENLGNGTVLWKKDDSKIIAVGNAVVVPDSRFSVVFDESANKYDLTLQRAKEKDSGRYTLVVDLREKKLTKTVNVRILTDGLSSPNEQPETSPWMRTTTHPTHQGTGGKQGDCNPGYYQCRSRHCLEVNRWCDGREDCPDKDDEQSCNGGDSKPEDNQSKVCRPDEFQCRYVGSCIPASNRCNGVYDCSDCSDEVGCPGKTPCRKGDFKCESGECVSQDRRCDGKRDCEDGSDERQCADGARCMDGSMPEISAYGVYYCWNSAMCPSGTMCKHGLCCRSNGQKACSPDQFECASDMRCISRSLLCNRQYDCRDGSDEVLSICGDTKPKCYSTQFQCTSGECIDADLKCNRRYDCSDGSDERDCRDVTVRCSNNQFQCQDGHCIDVRRKCDGFQDCPDRSDEINCPAPHSCDPTSEFRCESGECVDIRVKCDRRPDCRDSSDEQGCPTQQKCESNQFQCAQSGHCLDLGRRCDKYPDCPDRSDELGCPTDNNGLCLSNEFQCRSGECIDDRKKCDRVRDCRDNSDEQSCIDDVQCASDELKCPNGRCVNLHLRCDGRYDCPDGYDENNCPTVTRPQQPDPDWSTFDHCDVGEFQCLDTKDCISIKARCDGVAHCNDASDERDCQTTLRPVACSYNEFQCKDDMRCISLTKKCDRQQDCYDSSDEHDCQDTNEVDRCRVGEFQCRDGSCIHEQQRCDGRYDCRDSSDEINCDNVPKQCRSDEFKCISDGQCIDSRRKCDRHYDCHDGSDEDRQACGCSLDEYQCGSGECVRDSQRCDGRADCRDRSDEANCPQRPCNRDEFTCHSGECILLQRRCDQLPDCRDSSDEQGCADNDLLAVHVYPSTHETVIAGRETVLTCQASGVQGVIVKWIKDGSSSLPVGVQDRDGRLIIYNTRSEHGGGYICSASNGHSVKEVRVQLTVDTSAGTADLSVGRCRPGEATCRSGECISRDSLCDGVDDCRDRSDEYNCGPSRQCEPNEFVCNNRVCVQKMWVCDSEDDCGDNSDERQCGTKRPGDRCFPYEFSCQSRDQCVPKSYQCDGQNDCQDGSDEFGCSDPVVVEPPYREKTVCRGDTIVITCRAVGVPVPFINWRLNWGPVCAEPRCTQTSVDGFGTLTIRDANDGDQGAYTCEAINVRKRIMAVPDAIITVSDCRPTEPTRPVDHIITDRPNNCNPWGTLTVLPDGSCQCKHYVTGPFCDRCVDFAYNLAQHNPHGCIRCFAMGVTKICQSADYYRDQERLIFRGDNQGVTTCDFQEQDIRTPPLDYDVVPNCMTERAQQSSSQIRYWRMPERLLGNKLTAYGGKLKFSFQYSGSGANTNEPLVVLKGNEITLVYRPRISQYSADVLNVVEIDMFETSWTREDGRPVTREHLLMTLANLETFLIKQTHCQSQSSSSLGEVSLDIAVPHQTGQERAWAVEHCSCPQGYIGLSCEECAPGWERSGGGLYLGTCVPSDDVHADTTRPPVVTRPPDGGDCNTAGSLSPYRDPRTGLCQCKEYATGARCDQCKAHSFYLNEKNPGGCISCFCSGVTRDCDSTLKFRQTETVNDFSNWSELRVLSNEQTNPFVSRSTASGHGDLIFSDYSDAPHGRALYIEIPQRVLRNYVTAYGGFFRFTFRYSGDGSDEIRSPCAIIRGNDISLQHFYSNPTYADQEVTISVPIYENTWVRDDSKPSTREHLLMTLSDISAVMIKATWKDSMRSFTLKSVSIDHATDQHSSAGRAFPVEECRCPPGYVGTSCEDCASGYSRTGGGLYLGLCEACFCNGHSDECDSEYGDCLDCRDNTMGAKCEQCKPGYRGDATRGTPFDCVSDSGSVVPAGCQDCHCHGHSPSGCDDDCRCLRCEHNTEGKTCGECKAGFYGNARHGTVQDCQPCPCPGARECFLDSDGQVTCRGCPPGYDGRLCRECAPGYFADPFEPERCKPTGIEGDDSHKFTGDQSQKKVIRAVPDYLEVQEGGNATFQCHIYNGFNKNAYNLIWTKMGSLSLPKNCDARLDTLTFTNANLGNTGDYVCTGSSPTKVETAVATLIVVKLISNEEVIVAGCPERTLLVGESLRMKCGMAKLLPSTAFRWVRLDGPVSSFAQTHDEGVLYIETVRIEDGGSYECQAYHTFTGRIIAFERVKITVANETEIQVILEVSKEIIYSGDEVVFKCRVVGDSRAKIMWEKGNETLPLHSVANKEFLTITNITDGDAGVYSCLALTRTGLYKVDVVVQVQPKVDQSNTNTKYVKRLRLRRYKN